MIFTWYWVLDTGYFRDQDGRPSLSELEGRSAVLIPSPFLIIHPQDLLIFIPVDDLAGSGA